MNRSTGNPAPHKPLLLLVVLDLAETGELPDVLPLSGELTFRLTQYWGIVAPRRKQKPDIRMPFHYLGSDGVWAPLDAAGGPSPDLKMTVAVRVDPDFAARAREAGWRDQARRVLIARYFEPHERAGLYTLAGLELPNDTEQIHTPGYEPAAQIARGRSARFRTSIVAAYDFTCALTRHRLVTVDAGSLVDAAHIHRFADSQDDDIQNGLALSKNMHWLFDAGMWTITDDFRAVVAAEHFFESAPDQKPLRDYHGLPLRMPADSRFHPLPANLARHRRRVFRGSVG